MVAGEHYREFLLYQLHTFSLDDVDSTNDKYLLSDSEEEDDHIPEINEFLSWKMPDGPDDDDDDDEDPEEQEEFINSDQFSSSLPIDSEQSGDATGLRGTFPGHPRPFHLTFTDIHNNIYTPMGAFSRRDSNPC
ncbi:hypothetical protein GEV33_009172 [Tenebrio molitor]|uniref:Uncharacterized protein n=1 Tax=Tenebrio molitor TaxID=7067 RepID=A0A8J6HFB4_TENMO|nr:hypothetical protein GEV33_009172 [Tenebrio molitor]